MPLRRLWVDAALPEENTVSGKRDTAHVQEIAAIIREQHESAVVSWPEPSPLAGWWEQVMHDSAVPAGDPT